MSRFATGKQERASATRGAPPRAYLSLAAAALRSLLAYQGSFLFGLLAMTFGTLAMLYLWRAVLDHGGSAGGFDWPAMKAYLLVTYVAGALVSNYTDYRMASRIRDGDVALDLVRPVDYQRARFAEASGVAVYEVGAALVVTAVAVLAFGGVPTPAAEAAGLFVVSAALVLPLRFCVVYMSALATFWTQNYVGVNAARIALVTMFSGAVVPLVFFPAWLRDVITLLPFAGMASTPGLIYVGALRGSAAVTAVAVQAAWAFGLWVLARALWLAASRKLTVHGG
jgi:ABC-2 type transport system permease protein